MLQKHFKNILQASLIFAAVSASAFIIHPARAAETVFMLHAVSANSADSSDYSVDAAALKSWQTPPTNNVTYVSFEPEQNLNHFVLKELGLQQQDSNRVDYQKYNVGAVYQYLKSIEPEINNSPEDAEMKIENNRVTEFNPGHNGQDLDIKTSIDGILAALDSQQNNADLSIVETRPNNALADTNTLGIKELVAFGESNFAGSPNNRVFNINVGIQKEAGVILAPGQEFSFNDYLGPVDGEHGFLPELVIKKSGTVPEFGGGLCQVSSTVFRAAVNAGLPITERRNHSYAVSYYAPQGTDATIYPGVQDMKFVNNTQGSLLVWPEIKKNILRFYLYGTKDTRQVALDGPHSYDKKPDGSLKAVWYRTTTMPDGSVKKDIFNSNYQSPALFHKVETFPAEVNTSIAAPSPATPKSSTPVTQ